GVLFLAQFAVTCGQITHCQVVVAVLAFQRAAACHLQRDFQRHSLLTEMIVKRQTELAVRDRVHSHAPEVQTRPAEVISERNKSTSCAIWERSPSNSFSMAATISSRLQRWQMACQIVLPTSFNP